MEMGEVSPGMGGEKPRASVCIPTRNRRYLLAGTLRSLEAQSVGPGRLQVVIADDGSTDGTAEYLDQLAFKLPIERVSLPGRGGGAARNAAASRARGDVLIFLDDDQLCSSELVAAHLAVHQRFGDVLVQGLYPLAAGCNRRGTSLVYQWAQSRTLSALSPLVVGGFWHVWGGNISVRRATWARAGGYDEQLPRSQDLDFGLRVAGLGVPFVFEPRALSYHVHSISAAGFRRQHFSEGRTMARLSAKHGLPIGGLLGGRYGRLADRLASLAWRLNPAAAHRIGVAIGSSLWAADTLGLPSAQLAAARLLRRYFEVGGITAETLSLALPRSLQD